MLDSPDPPVGLIPCGNGYDDGRHAPEDLINKKSATSYRTTLSDDCERVYHFLFPRSASKAATF